MTYITESEFVFSSNWLNPKALNFFKSLSFDGYFLAGNSVANGIEKIPLQGDLDFWINSKEKILDILQEFISYYKNVDLYPSMLKLYNEEGDLPEINLIYTNLNYEELISKFDFDYCRCLYHP